MEENKKEDTLINKFLLSLFYIFLILLLLSLLNLEKINRYIGNNSLREYVKEYTSNDFSIATDSYKKIIKDFEEKIFNIDKIENGIYRTNNIVFNDLLNTRNKASALDLIMTPYGTLIEYEFNDNKITKTYYILSNVRGKDDNGYVSVKLTGTANYTIDGSVIKYSNIVGDKNIFYEEGDPIMIVSDGSLVLQLEENRVMLEKVDDIFLKNE